MLVNMRHALLAGLVLAATDAGAGIQATMNYDFGRVPAGERREILFRLKNTNSVAPITVAVGILPPFDLEGQQTQAASLLPGESKWWRLGFRPPAGGTAYSSVVCVGYAINADIYPRAPLNPTTCPDGYHGYPYGPMTGRGCQGDLDCLGGAQFRSYGLETGPGPWHAIENYREGAGKQWSFVPVGDGTFVHVRTDNVGSEPEARALFRVYRREGDAYVPGPWHAIDNYREGAGKQWSFVPVGDGTFLHVRTDNVGSEAEARALFRVYRREGDAYVPGPWHVIDNYREGAGKQWSFVPVGDGTFLHVRTDNVGSEAEARALFRIYRREGDAYVPGPWHVIDSHHEGGKPWSFVPVGDGTFVHVRTDNIGSEAEARAQFRIYREEGDAGPWHIIDSYHEGGKPWSFVPVGDGTFLHVRTDNVGSEAEARALFRIYRQEGDTYVPGPWHDIGEYREGPGTPWSFLPLDGATYLHVRTTH